jgi:hypothetical protein
VRHPSARDFARTFPFSRVLVQWSFLFERLYVGKKQAMVWHSFIDIQIASAHSETLLDRGCCRSGPDGFT